jgi:UDP-N-acetylmuramoylalanine--D-glutamate ligase
MSGTAVMKNSLKDARAAVVGAGRSGRSAARLLHHLGAKPAVLERNPSAPDEEFRAWADGVGVPIITGEHRPEHFQDLDFVVLSPGVHADALRPLIPRGVEIMAEMELAGRFAKGRIFAVTGTNGKTTSTALAGHVLERLGRKVFVGGNIGSPLSDHALSDQEAEVLVLEVSSFQGQNLLGFRPDVAVLLNFSPNHLDYHTDMGEYLEAKLNLFSNMKGEDLAVLPEDMRSELEGRDFTSAERIYFAPQGRFEVAGLPGRHNQANMEAVFQGLGRFGVGEDEMRDALKSFHPHPHRLETVLTAGGVSFVDDSKSTTLDSLKAALEALPAPVILLAGGLFKGGEPSGLIPLLKSKVKSVWLYGGSREVFEPAWSPHVPLAWRPTLGEAMRELGDQLRPGDTVLLSPAAASFDQYKDYKARGEDFARTAREMAG